MGFIGSVLTLLGWNRRLSKLEDNKVDKDPCTKDMERHDESIKSVKDDLTYIRGRVDKLLDIMVNGKR